MGSGWKELTASWANPPWPRESPGRCPPVKNSWWDSDDGGCSAEAWHLQPWPAGTSQCWAQDNDWLQGPASKDWSRELRDNHRSAITNTNVEAEGWTAASDLWSAPDTGKSPEGWAAASDLWSAPDTGKSAATFRCAAQQAPQRPRAPDYGGTCAASVRRPGKGWEHPGGNPIRELRIGSEVQGYVTNITKAGAFINVGAQKDGLLSASHRASRELVAGLKVGDQVPELEIVAVDDHRKRISLLPTRAALCNRDDTLEKAQGWQSGGNAVRSSRAGAGYGGRHHWAGHGHTSGAGGSVDGGAGICNGSGAIGTDTGPASAVATGAKQSAFGGGKDDSVPSLRSAGGAGARTAWADGGTGGTRGSRD
eukprot:NODE_1311_length_1179_cov_263.873665.p1 GENE.NODE_1311_length_1179_cov_263.873665~~NODE_1311_length_1179_cov_263.873665.p1  ORF type:complete len:366 (+),score=34.21 NODE_1311_length_1179_cov_263.873665:3-1100(+)